MTKKMPHSFDLINWFCSALRGNTNHLCHYLDDIRGCGLTLEHQARDNFFQIIEGLLYKLQKNKEETEVRQILNSLKWDYQANDHSILEKLGIFRMIRDGDSSSEKLKKLWGSKFKYEFIFKEAPAAGTVKTKEQDRKEDFALLNKVELSREVIDLFETCLVSTMGKSF
jgi:hemerythrin-like domain-containing protein